MKHYHRAIGIYLVMGGLFLFSCAAGTKTYIRDRNYCVQIYQKLQPGETTEEEFLSLVAEASIYDDVVDGHTARIKQCGWVLTSETKSRWGTSHHYKVICPVSLYESLVSYVPETVLYYAFFSDGVLVSVSTP